MKSPVNTEGLEAYFLFAVAAVCFCWFSYRHTVPYAGGGATVVVEAPALKAPTPSVASFTDE